MFTTLLALLNRDSSALRWAFWVGGLLFMLLLVLSGLPPADAALIGLNGTAIARLKVIVLVLTTLAGKLSNAPLFLNPQDKKG